MTHTAVSELYPLSSSQREIWFEQVLHQRSSMHNIGGYVRIGGAVDPRRFEQAIELLIRKYDCLRTVLIKGRGDDDVPMQTFALQMPLSVPVHDFSSEQNPHASALAWMQARFDEPFALYGRPLTRHDLLKVGPNLYYWLLQYHHIIVDGWSIALLCRSLAEIYSTLQRSAAPDLTARSYVEFIKDDRAYMEGETFKRQRTYWLEKYRNPPDSLLKPRSRNYAAEGMARSECRSLQLSRGLYDQLIALAKPHGATAYHVILAALYVYFVRTERRQELVVGLPVLNRSNAAFKSTAGLFVGVSAVRFDFGTDLSFAELLRGIGRVLKQEYRQQRFPVSELNREVLQRTGRQQLFDLRVSYERHDHGTMFGEARGHAIALLNSYQPTPLTLFVREFHDNEAVDLDFVYNQAYFAAEEIDAIQRRLLGVLTAVVLDDEQPIGRLPLMSEAERYQLLVQWNQTQRDYPADRCVHELFEEQAERTPDALALEYEGQQLTYAQLNAQANRLAHYLAGLQVGPQGRVALDLQRSAALVIAQLAILKCGSAYVPMDEDAPLARKAWMLSDCAARVVLSIRSRELPRLPGLQKVDLDEIDLSAAHSENLHGIRCNSGDVAYVMYTSGSTGEPKGVQVPHRAISRLVLNNGYADFRATDRVAFAANPAFDASTLEVWAALLNGGCSVVVDRHSVLEPQVLRRVLGDRRISVLWLSVGLFNQVARAVPDAFGSLRYLLVGGDALDPKTIAQVLQAAPPQHLLNGYGPTETTTFATTYEIRQVAVDAVSVPIGRPIANTRIYILDDRGQPVPMGAAGEIYIGGAGVAHGYLRRPELTAERFVSDPFSAGSEARMYRTGDVGRYLPDGNVEYLGRNDAQVKIRGYRIELGEIEARLRARPEVREAVVLAAPPCAAQLEGGPVEKRLVAYVVSETRVLDVEQLREQLLRELPEYMVPAAYVQLEALPLTANGKLDRKALPAPEVSAFAQGEYEAPEGDLEQMLARIWSELLGVERIGRRDHFLKLGGHSLLAVQLMSRVRERLGIEVSLQQLFAHPVLSEFSHLVGHAGRSALPPLQTFARPEQLPLSYAQQRLWFVAQLDNAAGAAYHMPAALRLRGNLDEGALKRALDRIVFRHEVLRTRFELEEGQPVQRIAPADVGIEWQRQNLSSAKDELEQAEQVRYWSEREAHAPFDLARDALIRTRLLQLTEQDHVLLLTMHHIVSDGWSVGVLVRELSALYRAFSRGQADPLAPLEIQYADYALWQRQCLQERLQQQLSYWKQELQGAPELVNLLTDRARPPVQDYAGDCVEIELDSELTEQLHELSRRHGTTLHMILLSAWAGLVGRLSGQQEVVIGTPVANRTETRTEELIGFFVNSLALRVDLRGGPTVAELLGRVRRCSVQGQSHQDVPFEQVVEALNPSRVLSHHPIFQLMFVWQNAPHEVLELGELSLEWLPSRYHRAKFDLTLNLQQRGDRIVGELEYASALYEPETVQRHVRYLQAMLRAMVADERQSIERVPLLSEVERHRLLVEWNHAQRSFFQDRCIHELFEEQASRTPGAPALVFGDQQLSYGQLNAQANRLARYLRALGVGPETRVAILAERSVEMVVGLLAILKAGGAYVPLDPAYPLERLSYMLSDSGAAALLVCADMPPESSLQLRQSLRSGVPVVDLRADVKRWCRRSGQNIDRKQSAAQVHQLAYVIYTSGSTGEPKGVMVEHANVTRLFSATRDWFEFDRNDVWTLFHSFAFDFSVWEIWGALLHGGRLVVVPHLTSRSPQEFYELVCAEGVTVLNQTPGAFRQLIAAQARSDKSHRLRYVIFGGEALELTMLKPWFDRSDNDAVQLINMYGITETTVHVTYHRLQQREVSRAGASPIGRRIPDLRIYVLDQYGQPVPLGVAGEIYVGGAGVARGYLNRPELTMARFVKDSFSSEPDARMYRTGDLGRYLPDGSIEYLGRNDRQVKIRGYRIELGEIEARLSAQPAVREGVVVVREDAPGEKRLVAYVVSESAELDVAQLREALSRELPEHMLPAAYVQLESLPLTPNGKLDRKALPSPHRSAFAQRGYEAPQGELEQMLARIWSELLGVERIGRGDQFFQLGGHSLLAVQLMERMRRAGLYAEIRTLFIQPTLSGFAQAVREAQQSGQREVEVPPNVIEAGCQRITPSMLPLTDLTQEQIDQVVSRVPGGVANIQDIYPLAPLQEGILFHHLLQREGDPYLVMSTLSFQSVERLQAFVQALQNVIDRHDILRTAVLWEGLPEPVQVVWRRAPLAVEEIEVQGIDDVAAHLRACFDPRRYRIDVRIAPLLRVVTARDERNSRWLLLCLLHHLVDDNTSMKQLSKEIRAHLLERVEGLPAPIAFRNFVAQARLGVSKQEHEAFFRQMLADVREPTAPYGLLQVHGAGADVLEEQLSLERSLSRRIRVQARALGVSTASIFHFAWGLVLSRLSVQDDVVFGTVLFGRMQGGAGADRALGLFINTLPIRVRLGEMSVAKGIKHTHESLAQLMSHEHASLVLAQRCSGVPAQVPLFSALLNYRHGVGELAVESEWVEGIEVLCTQERTNYPCALSVDDTGRDFALTMQVVTPLSPQCACRYMQQSLSGVVQALEHAPETPAWRIGVLDEAERHQVLVQWNQTQRESPKNHCIHELFEQQVERTPDATALVHGEQQLSYGQLNSKANQLARYLETLGVGSEVRVAILAERNLETVMSVLAILKAGGAYVPLDPAYPVERLSYMLRDSGAAVLLVDDAAPGMSLQLRQSLDARVPVVDVRTDAAHWIRRSGQNIDRNSTQAQPHHLAYVIYTSGSTGEPKGVMIEHRNVVNLWFGIEGLYRQQIAFPRIGVNAPMTFDASVQQWVQLLSGCTLLILPQRLRLDPRALLAFIRQNALQGIDCTPSQLKSWISAGLLEKQGGTLRTVLVGGEAIDPTLWDSLARSLEVRFHNVYGPTECTVDTTSAHPADFPDLPNIGRPLPNTRVYILDERRQPTPLGVAGELYIGGAGVARGYLNRPVLTTQRFVKDPFSSESDARMYRTGDLGRYLPDGTIEYLGRNDEQVKIRGFRIELGEIEARLTAQPGVHEAVVLAAPAHPARAASDHSYAAAREDASGEKRLVAYVVSESESLNVAQLRERLLRELPEYMVPAAYVQLDALPLSPNGKLDRRALPTPEDAAFAQHAYEAPQGELEQALARIWSDLLGVERIGRDDHFFELGGHSLLAVQLMERMRQQGLYADIRTLFTQPSLRGFAEAVRDAQQAGWREVNVPPNAIGAGCERITPSMLPLIDLTQAQIDQIVRSVAGGVSNIQDIYPLAPLQEGILFHHLLQQEGDPYLVVSTLSFSSRERLDEFVQALQTVIDRHDILRTAVLWERLPEPVQVVLREARMDVQMLALQAEDVRAQLERHSDPAHYRLDIRHAPLLKGFAAFDERANRWLLRLAWHHLISDHSALEALVQEVRLIQSGQQRLLSAPMPFRNFVAQARLGVSKQEHEAFFRQMLMDVEEPTAPYGLLQVHGDGSEILEEKLLLERLLSLRIRHQARALGVSAASLFHFAWGQVLSRLSGRDDVVFGTVLLGRMQGGAGADRALGLFMNTLPVRISFGEAAVAEGVKHTHESLAQLMRHEHASLALAQRCSGVSAHVPLFSALLNYRHSEASTAAANERIAEVDVLSSQERTNYPCVLSVDDLGNDFALTVQVVRPLSAQSICRYVQQALSEVVSALERSSQSPAWQLGVLDAAERHQLLVKWNQTRRSYPQDRCVHELFEEQVARTPDAIAVVYAGQSLSYAELNARSNQLARVLRDKAVGPDQRVSICVARSLELIVGLMGILKAGGAYVPLDPTYPAERLAYMLQDAAPTVLLTQERLKPYLPPTTAEMIALDDWSAIAARERTNLPRPSPRSAAHNLAYVIHTSGSTGKPKGVMVEHAGVVNCLTAMLEHLEIGVTDCMLAVTTVSFDIAGLEIFLPLLNGARVVLVSRDAAADAKQLIATVEELEVSLMQATPTTWQLLLAAGWKGRSGLRALCGGEALRTELSRDLVSRVGSLWNLYGPTETTIWSCIRRITAAERDGVEPIGRPIANTRVFILDSRMRLAPIGVTGEIYIAGAGVARGYLNRPELTMERFVVDHCSDGAPARMYKTGDLGQRRADGTIEFMGRNDQQVKIRGFRIELEEIESQIARHAQVTGAIVVAREDVVGENRLVAYITQPDHDSLNIGELRAHLKSVLPEYMVPSAFVKIESFPRTPNGKLDRRALPAPDGQAYATRQYEAPIGAVETAVAQIWSELLKVERIGRQDNFFELGGHSLTDLKLVTRIAQQFDVQIHVQAVYQRPTVQQMAQLIDELLPQPRLSLASGEPELEEYVL